jgi:predicted pyridoxine 5'-phosphate oxidase superfamily flavin-nucleotide-binding protein
MVMSHLDEPPVSPWHAGERLLQQSVGVAERMEAFGNKVIREFLPEQHRSFYALLPYLLLGAVDDQGVPWATLLEGPPGFAHSPDPQVLQLDSLPAESDPVRPALRKGAAVGLLGIDLKTRRRNRMNGTIGATAADGFAVNVVHTFGNCPKYIQLRAVDPGSQGLRSPNAVAQRSNALDEATRAMIRQADTFFVASYVDVDGDVAKRSVDVSHRGGNTGFIKVEGNVLTIPDFAGNLHFNTLGNLLLNPVAGLLFIDFESGDVLQLAGSAELILSGPELAGFQGAERLWTVTVEHVVRRTVALALRWQFEGFSPHSLSTGSWPATRR